MEEAARNILVIMDDEDIVDRLEEYLPAGKDVKHCLHSENRLDSGLDYISRNDIDLVFLALDLPDSEGFNTFERARQSAYGVPIVVLISVDEIEAAKEAIRHGARDYLVIEKLNRRELEIIAGGAFREREFHAQSMLVEDDLSKLFQDYPEAIIIFDSAGMIMLANPAAESILGLAPEELVGSLFGFSLTGGGHTEVEIKHEDSGPGTAEMNISKTQWRGEPAYIATFRDVTDRRQMEDKLRESEAKYRLLVENLQEGIMAINEKAVTTFINERMAEMLGYKVEEMLGKPLFAFMDEEATGVAKSYIERRRVGKGKRQEFDLISKNGSKIHVSVAMTPVANENGDYRGAIMALADVTDLQRAAIALEDQTKELSDLIDVAAHELRHPATIFKGYSTLLLEQWDNMSEEMIREALVSIDLATNRLAHLVNELFEASRIERGTITMAYQEISPYQLVMRAIHEIRAVGNTNRFNVRTLEDDEIIEVDAERVKDVIYNLIDNAVKYSDEGSDVDIWWERGNDEVVFSIADRGIGISVEDRAKVFDRFFQVEDAIHHSTPGIGLGLYIGRNYVVAHRGWMRLDPREGGGSVFTFGIPLYQSREAGDSEKMKWAKR
ncbi:MAG: PAS domain S-box protein [Actinobacteria bacterium]|nr:PAS domain S-box protein [Actinomycetota bacterium]